MGKWSKKLGTSLMLTGISMSLLAPSAFSTNKAMPLENSYSKTSAILESAPIDMHLVDQDRLAKALKEQGIIAKNASSTETEKAVKKYIELKNQKPAGTAETKDQQAKEISKQSRAFLKKQKEKLSKKLNNTQTLTTGSGFMNVDPAKPVKYKGDVRTDKVLVLLAEFSDFSHNNIEQEEGYMYSDDFSREHYEKMLFGDEDFELFDGTKVKTFKQYYEEQSGGSYTVDGHVTNWVTVPGKAKDYGDDAASGHDNRNPLGPRDFVKDALKAAVADGVNLAEFDQLDIYDLDGDGNLNEPDGLVDHLMVIHAGVGQEAGGGALGADAIWSHRWVLDGVFPVPGTQTDVPYWGGKMGAYDYTIEPEDGAVGVFAHEYGHDLGLPDEYDTQYSGDGEPVESWSIMSGGSWNGRIAGTEPTSFSPQNKEYFQKVMGGNWANMTEIDLKDITASGTLVKVDQSVTKSKNPGLVKVNLPQKEVESKIQPAFGEKYYYSTKGDNLHTSMESPLFDLTNKTSATFTYKANYEIENGGEYDKLSVYVQDQSGNILKEIERLGWTATKKIQYTTEGNWVDKSYDLSEFKGKKVKLVFDYQTDGGLAPEGFALDNAQLTADGVVVFSDDAEGSPKFKLNHFIVSNGISFADHYYYIEWRNTAGSDKALQSSRGVKYNTGMVVWYGDDSFTDNWTGIHPGEGFIGVVDSHPKAIVGTKDGLPTVENSTRYQIADAAFSFDKTPSWYVNSPSRGIFDYKSQNGVPVFNDSVTYIDNKDYNGSLPDGVIDDAGKKLPKYGLKFTIIGEASDNSAGLIKISK
ncbi:immune inhibitor A domain-containing protein [Fictibacillus phosphorivorans]|uniref:immune inhibitor A domain-containing protein n=1 Tax=Fictibacillus phosphorivorans TaxID=1221500 RepID=UPI00203CAE99|nr:immune inhibitor A domain-containing protein [Fictibacillus phosphorivorans]MCM3717673.1 immune inhibitor A [Fictibacillus phosphorivorans]MCM3775573.1 immune inhibitor A [Fictibacillus phosphorivorans]